MRRPSIMLLGLLLAGGFLWSSLLATVHAAAPGPEMRIAPPVVAQQQTSEPVFALPGSLVEPKIKTSPRIC